MKMNSHVCPFMNPYFFVIITIAGAYGLICSVEFFCVFVGIQSIYCVGMSQTWFWLIEFDNIQVDRMI